MCACTSMAKPLWGWLGPKWPSPPVGEARPEVCSNSQLGIGCFYVYIYQYQTAHNCDSGCRENAIVEESFYGLSIEYHPFNVRANKCTLHESKSPHRHVPYRWECLLSLCFFLESISEIWEKTTSDEHQRLNTLRMIQMVRASPGEQCYMRRLLHNPVLSVGN